MNTCCIPGCDKPRHQRHTLCGSHYMRKYRYGDPQADRGDFRQRGRTTRNLRYWTQWLVSELRVAL